MQLAFVPLQSAFIVSAIMLYEQALIEGFKYESYPFETEGTVSAIFFSADSSNKSYFGTIPAAF
jgi:hypothetical protein